MSILEIRALAQPIRPGDNARRNQIERHARTLSTSPQASPAGSFFSTAWRRISSFLSGSASRPTSAMTASCDRLLSPKTCEEISNGYFHALYRKECNNDRSPSTYVPEQQAYAGEHSDLRKRILQEPEFLEKYKALPKTARFYLAEMKAHERQLYADAYLQWHAVVLPIRSRFCR